MTLQELVENIFTQVKVETDKKVDKEVGKGLSTNDYTNEDKDKLDSLVGIPSGGTAGQVLTKQSSEDGDVDWEDSTGGGSTDPITSSDVEDIAEEILGNSTPITITIDEPKVPGTTYTATAASALQKGDTVYLDTQEGEWSDITALAGLSVYRYNDGYGAIAISSDSRKVLAYKSQTEIGIWDTTTTPWTYRNISELFGINDNSSDSSNCIVGQDGDIALVRGKTNGASRYFFIDLQTEEVTLSALSTATMSANNSRHTGNRIRINDGILYVNRFAIDIETGNAISNCGSIDYVNRYQWISPNRVIITNTNGQLCEYEVNGNTCNYIHSISIDGSNYGSYIHFANGRLFTISQSSDRSVIKYLDDYDTWPWNLQSVNLPEGFNPNGDSSFVSIDGSEILIPKYYGSPYDLYILNTDTLNWTLVGDHSSATSSSYTCYLSSNIAILHNNVYRRTGSGLIARKIYNKIRNNKVLAYAATDIAAGQKGTFITLFN